MNSIFSGPFLSLPYRDSVIPVALLPMGARMIINMARTQNTPALINSARTQVTASANKTTRKIQMYWSGSSKRPDMTKALEERI